MAIKPESIWTADDLSYTVLVYNYNPREQSVGSVIKYSKKQYSPFLADNIRFSTPGCFRTINISPGSELTKDELEATRQKYIPIDLPSKLHTELAKSYNAKPSQFMTRLKLTTRTNDCWIYSTASDFISADSISPSYDCITRIDNPHKFALLIGKNFAETICSKTGFAEEHLEYRSRDKDFETYNRIRESNKWIGEKVIVVIHGFVEYTYDESDDYNGPIQFIKRSAYKLQQEYRFSVQVLGFSIKKPYVDIETPSNAKSLMSLVGSSSLEPLVIENSLSQNMVERLLGERIENVQLQCRDDNTWSKVCEYDINTHQRVDIDTRISQNYLNLDLLNVDVSKLRSTGRLDVSLRDGALKRDNVTNIFRFAVKCAGHPLHIIPINMNRISA